MLGWSVFASSLTATTGTVQAQGSVTLYGIVDTGISYYNHAAKGGSAVGMPHLTGEQMKRTAIWGTMTLALRLGQAVFEARRRREPPEQAVLAVAGGLDGYLLGEGRHGRRGC